MLHETFLHWQKGRLGQRKNRFVAEVWFEDGPELVYCPSTGSLKTCWGEGEPCWVSLSSSSSRKLSKTLEIVTKNQEPIFINTHRANDLYESLLIRSLKGENFEGLSLMQKDFGSSFEIQREVSDGVRSRFDFRLKKESKQTWIELKTVTMDEKGKACFPDAITLRGQKHLRGLMEKVKNGEQAFLIFLFSRPSSISFQAAQSIDPNYAELLRKASLAGVQIRLFKILWIEKQFQIHSYQSWEPPLNKPK